MKTSEIKSNFHNLIDSIDNDSVLLKFYELMERALKQDAGVLWQRLTETERDELMLIDSETDSQDNLIPHKTIRDKHKKWLE
jgi:hypothetical protein